MPKIKVGQIGTAHAHAGGKMSALRNSSEYEVVGVVEPDEQRRQRAARTSTYKDVRWMSAEQLLNTPGLQAVAVETAVRDLLTTAETCVDAGMHVHIDKPAGSSLSHFKRVLDKAAAKHLAVQMGYMYRYNPGVVLLREMLQKGWLGEPFEVHAVMSKVVPPANRKPLSEYPGGMMFELSCHLIDSIVKILGKPEEVTPFYQHAADVDDTLRDNMLAVFTYPKAIASVKTAAMEVEGFRRRHLVLCGTEGTLHIQPLDRPAVQLSLSKARGKYAKGFQEVELPNYVRYIDDVADLAKIIRMEKANDFSYEHDLAVQETVLRASGVGLEPGG